MNKDIFKNLYKSLVMVLLTFIYSISMLMPISQMVNTIWFIVTISVELWLFSSILKDIYTKIEEY